MKKIIILGGLVSIPLAGVMEESEAARELLKIPSYLAKEAAYVRELQRYAQEEKVVEKIKKLLAPKKVALKKQPRRKR